MTRRGSDLTDEIVGHISIGRDKTLLTTGRRRIDGRDGHNEYRELQDRKVAVQSSLLVDGFLS